MRISNVLRATRRLRRLTQRELADRVGVGQSRVALIERGIEEPRFSTAARLLLATGYTLVAAPTVRSDVAAIAGEIRLALADGNESLALRLFIQMNDNLVGEHGLVRGVLAVCEPERTGSKTWDAAIAALVAYRLNQDRVPLPVWAESSDRRLRRVRALLADPNVLVPPRSAVPDEFLAHGVLVWRDMLESV
ncbi:helix-turn-helix domain-containing protein [Agromyces soli]